MGNQSPRRSPHAPAHRTPLRGLFVLAIVLLSFVQACASDPAGPKVTGTQGIDNATLNAVFAHARGMPRGLSLVVQRNGVLVREEYFNGSTQSYVHDVRSVTKSVISILIGIAIEKGFIPSVDEPVGTYLQPLVDDLRPEVASVPIRQFLKMSSGLDWHELDGGDSYDTWVTSDDMIQHVVDLPMVHSPGARFLYSTGASHLLSVVLTEATGQSTSDFAREHLFDPLGIGATTWLQGNRGYNTGGMGLGIRARDMAKIGQLFLDNGSLNGSQVVPAQWISESTAPLLPTRVTVRHYGYLWWIGTVGGETFYLASGYGGQFILIHPGLDLVVVSQAWWSGIGWDNADDQWLELYRLIVEELLPGVK